MHYTHTKLNRLNTTPNQIFAKRYYSGGNPTFLEFCNNKYNIIEEAIYGLTEDGLDYESTIVEILDEDEEIIGYKNIITLEEYEYENQPNDDYYLATLNCTENQCGFIQKFMDCRYPNWDIRDLIAFNYLWDNDLLDDTSLAYKRPNTTEMVLTQKWVYDDKEFIAILKSKLMQEDFFDYYPMEINYYEILKENLPEEKFLSEKFMNRALQSFKYSYKNKGVLSNLDFEDYDSEEFLRMLKLAMNANYRHTQTNYEEILHNGISGYLARELIYQL